MDNGNFRRNGKDRKAYGRSSVASFFDRQGIYVVMLVCLALIGVTAYFALGSDRKTAENPDDNDGQQVASQVAPTLSATPSPTLTPTPTPTVTPKATAKAEVKLLLPVTGEILRPYSPTKPVYFETLKEWMVHTGVDIKAKEGTPVLAAKDGTVSFVAFDAVNGNMIIIDHGENEQTVYANLGSLDYVKKGQKVQRGDKISTVGRSATNTISDPAHLHFEYHQGDKTKDPMSYVEASSDEKANATSQPTATQTPASSPAA